MLLAEGALPPGAAGAADLYPAAASAASAALTLAVAAGIAALAERYASASEPVAARAAVL